VYGRRVANAFIMGASPGELRQSTSLTTILGLAGLYSPPGPTSIIQ